LNLSRTKSGLGQPASRIGRWPIREALLWARRTIKAALAPAWIEFVGAAQVRRTVTRKGKKTVEVAYLITSDRDADPATRPPGPAATGT
jgi:hypothetical protein